MQDYKDNTQRGGFLPNRAALTQPYLVYNSPFIRNQIHRNTFLFLSYLARKPCSKCCSHVGLPGRLRKCHQQRPGQKLIPAQICHECCKGMNRELRQRGQISTPCKNSLQWSRKIKFARLLPFALTGNLLIRGINFIPNTSLYTAFVCRHAG